MAQLLSLALLLSAMVAAAYAGAACQVTCSVYSAASKASSRTLCDGRPGTFTDISGTSAKCYTNAMSCSSDTDKATCASGAAALNADGSGTTGCTSSLVDCDSSAKCFPASATVMLEDGSRKTMGALAVGDRVLTKAGQFRPVYMFSHKLSAVQAEFVQLATAGGRSLQLTEDHYLYVNGSLAVAQAVRVGDTLTTGAGEKDVVVAVARRTEAGLFNPHTMDGDIVVNDILTSTYTSAIQPTLAHYALWPVRMLYSLGHAVVGDAFASGSELIASLLPDGRKVY